MDPGAKEALALAVGDLASLRAGFVAHVVAHEEALEAERALQAVMRTEVASLVVALRAAEEAQRASEVIVQRAIQMESDAREALAVAASDLASLRAQLTAVRILNEQETAHEGSAAMAQRAIQMELDAKEALAVAASEMVNVSEGFGVSRSSSRRQPIPVRGSLGFEDKLDVLRSNLPRHSSDTLRRMLNNNAGDLNKTLGEEGDLASSRAQLTASRILNEQETAHKDSAVSSHRAIQMESDAKEALAVVASDLTSLKAALEAERASRAMATTEAASLVVALRAAEAAQRASEITAQTAIHLYSQGRGVLFGKPP